MNQEERMAITSNDYGDIIISYIGNEALLEGFENGVVHIMNDAYAVIHIPVADVTARSLGQYGYSAIPNLYGLSSNQAVDASRVNDLRSIPALNLMGNGVLVGILDTGIDYTNPIFLREDGRSKVMAIWDQTIESDDGYPYSTYFGTEYSHDQINQALQAENPLEVVPSIDEIGHGTMLASAAVGNPVPEENFAGVAPGADLVIVKLRQAKPYHRNFFGIPEDTVCYQENMVMWGIQYCLQKARELARPIAICIGIGSSMDAHDGFSNLSAFTSLISGLPGVAIVAAAGNEGNLGRHYFGEIDPQIGYDTMELIVSEEDPTFTLEIWGTAPGAYSIDILSPSGEYIPRIVESLTVFREVTFIFEETVIFVDYQMVESQTGDQLILLRFRNMTPGTWRLNVYGRGDLSTSFHAWLPSGDFISQDTYFLNADNFVTLLAPGTAAIPITVTAYNTANNNLYINASRGYARNQAIKPDLAAPGVNYIAAALNNEFVPYTGTGVAAAHAAGIVALMLEWGVIRGNYPGMSSVEIKKFLIRGARRSPTITYPNRDWGFGIIDIYNVFDILRAGLIGI